jgi:hypothetical protein
MVSKTSWRLVVPQFFYNVGGVALDRIIVLPTICDFCVFYILHYINALVSSGIVSAYHCGDWS